MANDMMAHFELLQPAQLDDALALLERHGEDAWKLAGGHDSLSWFKDRVKRPKVVVELTGIDALRGIKETADGVEIGALTTLTEIEHDPLIRAKYALLAHAAGKVASPQIRNVGTLGGNVSQDARCWYYRYGLDCYRAGGNTCYADTPEGMNREHALFGADRCVAVSPSDTAPALIALDASMVIRNSDGERVVNAEDFFIGPAVNIERMTVLEPGDILTAIRIPHTWAGAQFYFEKVADRNTWDFALVNVASAMVVSNGMIERLRIACGGVECVPKRLKVVEEIVQGSPPDGETGALAGKSAVRGAKPLNYNHFKITLMENLVKRAIRDA
ncbi:MAG: xanthine dehydrogenase family protein subunit M [Gammaproteobacteria bacterium]|nr:xanthine dehydrogenase family protein subunit M [Gammaproteobacteria bacterium]